LIQTFDPEHYAIQAALKQDMAGFSTQEMTFRQEAGYPPFQRLAVIRLSALVKRDGEAFCREIIEGFPKEQGVMFLGPAPAPLSKLRGRFRWQILVKERQVGVLHGVVARFMGWAEARAGNRVRLAVDVDPYSFQ
ncbi:MAG: primosomal protein N', partial [Magnetococcales bacterium]|nr:primosomal protein N' [Magnetococcales bacterium]